MFSHSSIRSTRCSGCVSALTASARESASSWLASWEVRRVASRRRSTWSARRLSRSPPPMLRAAWAQASTWACRPASGVRSWCAASATKRRCASVWALTSWNRRLSEATRGRTSPGTLSVSIALRSRGERFSTASLRSISGRSARATPQVTTAAATANSSRLGSSTRISTVLNHCWRASEPSASMTMTSPMSEDTRWATTR